jgi:hypothetical protein
MVTGGARCVMAPRPKKRLVLGGARAGARLAPQRAGNRRGQRPAVRTAGEPVADRACGGTSHRVRRGSRPGPFIERLKTFHPSSHRDAFEKDGVHGSNFDPGTPSLGYISAGSSLTTTRTGRAHLGRQPASSSKGRQPLLRRAGRRRPGRRHPRRPRHCVGTCEWRDSTDVDARKVRTGAGPHPNVAPVTRLAEGGVPSSDSRHRRAAQRGGVRGTTRTCAVRRCGGARRAGGGWPFAAGGRRGHARGAPKTDAPRPTNCLPLRSSQEGPSCPGRH